MCFKLIYSRKRNAWFHAACPEAIKPPLQKEQRGDAHTHTRTQAKPTASRARVGAGPVRFTCA